MIIIATIAIGCNHLKRLRVKQIPHSWLFCDTAFEGDHPTRRREWGLELRKAAGKCQLRNRCPEERDSAMRKVASVTRHNLLKRNRDSASAAVWPPRRPSTRHDVLCPGGKGERKVCFFPCRASSSLRKSSSTATAPPPKTSTRSFEYERSPFDK